MNGSTTQSFPFALSAGLGSLLILDKPNGVLHLGLSSRWLHAELEAGLIWTTPSAGKSQFLGSPLNVHLLISPFRIKRLQLRTGFGLETYTLWQLHRGEIRHALGIHADATVYPIRQLGLRLGARQHLIESDGLELGVTRDGRRSLPVVLNVALVIGGRAW